MSEELLKDAIEAVKDTVEGEETPQTVTIGGVKHYPVKSEDPQDGVDRGEEVGWETDYMTESQTDRDVQHEEVDEEYTDVDGATPKPENDTGSEGNPDTGTKSVSDAVTEEDIPDIDDVEIGHLEINEYYRVWIKEPSNAPPEVELHPADEAQTPPPTPETSHYYEAPFQSSVAAVGLEEAAEKLAKYEPDPDFPTKSDMRAAELAQTDLFVVDAVLSRSVEKVTPTTLELTKSPLTLFYALKETPEDWRQIKRDIRDEISRRGIEGVDKIRKADPAEAPDQYDINKRKIYVESEEDVPDQYEAEYGPNGGIFYRPDGETLGDDEQEVNQLRDDLEQGIDEGDVVDRVPSSMWRDYAGQIQDEDLLFGALEQIQDHGAKFSKDRVRQRLRGMGYSPEEIDDRVADTQEPFSSQDHEEWDGDYVDRVEEVESLFAHEDASTGASAEAMQVEQLEDGTEMFVTNYGMDAMEQDPEYRSRQMATYEALRALTADENVPPHIMLSGDERADVSGDSDAVAVVEFDGEEAWEAPNTWANNVDREDYVEQTAKNFICGNNDLHGQNVMLNEDGDLAFHDLDHSAGRLDQDDPINVGNVANGSITNIGSTAKALNLDTEGMFEEIFEKAEELVEERRNNVEQLLEDTEDPHIGEMLENIIHNLELIEEAGSMDELREEL